MLIIILCSSSGRLKGKKQGGGHSISLCCWPGTHLLCAGGLGRAAKDWSPVEEYFISAGRTQWVGLHSCRAGSVGLQLNYSLISVSEKDTHLCITIITSSQAAVLLLGLVRISTAEHHNSLQSVVLTLKNSILSRAHIYPRCCNGNTSSETCH